MSESKFIRARSPEHKAQRAAEILSAATLVLDRDGIKGVTLASIATEAGVVKSNLYRYFESREEILFRLMLIESRKLEEAGNVALGAFEGQNDIEGAARAFARIATENSRFCLLISQMAPILEQNISVEKLIELKRETVGILVSVSASLHRAVPDLGEPGAIQVMHTIIFHIAGLWPMANPTQAVLKALEQPDLAFMKLDFEDSLAQTFVLLMKGTIR